MSFRDKKQYEAHYDAIEKHIASYFPAEDINVIHETVTLDIRVDIHHIKPKKLKFDLLLTAGMSSLEMNVSGISENADAFKFAELMILIPKGIEFGDINSGDTKNEWIISMLKRTAKFPHHYNTWIGIGHSIQADEKMAPYAKGTAYCGCLILPSMTFPEDFLKIDSPNGPINIYTVFPMYKEELEYKIENGFDNFIEFLIQKNTKEVLDFERKNYCRKS